MEAEQKLSKAQRDFIVENHRVQLMNYVQEYKYLVIDLEQKTKFWSSL